jgi:hypothetical protein
MVKKNISNASRDYRSLLLRLDHAHRSQPWKIMSIARAAMDNREAVAPRTLERGRGAVEKFKTASAPIAAAPKFCKTLRFRPETSTISIS